MVRFRAKLEVGSEVSLGWDWGVGEEKKRKAKATAADKAMQVVRRREMKRTVVGFDFGDENWSVLKERRAVVGFGGSSS